ncbi:MAG TPA: hypothetical protein VN714_06575, partial [Trebonia sp.]|nr:hypothetical protein [Trebonia sp.]
MPWSECSGGRLAEGGGAAGRCDERRAASKRLKASLVSPARVSPTPANWLGGLPPESRYRRAARQIGHHWHSGGSSVSSSVVAVSQTSALLPPRAPGPTPPRVDLTLPATSRPMLLAPAFI